jgi:hypothetical protein
MFAARPQLSSGKTANGAAPHDPVVLDDRFNSCSLLHADFSVIPMAWERLRDTWIGLARPVGHGPQPFACIVPLLHIGSLIPISVKSLPDEVEHLSPSDLLNVLVFSSQFRARVASNRDEPDLQLILEEGACLVDC